MPDSDSHDEANGGGWVVGEWDDSLIVMPVDEARSLTILNDALRDAQSWGDLLLKLDVDPCLREEVRDRYGAEFPKAAEPFSLEQIPGAYEGDWPALPRERMAAWLPEVIFDLGVQAPTLFGPDLLRISPRRRGRVVGHLRRLGLRCREDDTLVSRACGAWRFG